MSDLEIPASVLEACEAAQVELTHAETNLRKPGFSDNLAELRDRLIRAHEGLADAYEAVRASTTLPGALQAALKDASQLHRERSENIPPVRRV